mmetsp:Transcript_33559/g.106027  ORF Transcript_33559/g.106027 Transcript_33559/m.106027 type:complete len:496 (-) Transcript_33559:1507-2994(-)
MSFAESLQDGLPGGPTGEVPAVSKRGAVPRLSLYFVVSSGFFINLEYSIGMPTIYHYIKGMGGNTTSLGVCLALFPAASTLLYVPIGIWSDLRPMREVYISTVAVGIVGNFLYGAAGRADALWMVAVGRLLTGASAANRTLTRTYIARALPRDEQTSWIQGQFACNLLAILLGPVITLALLTIDIKVGWFELNRDTAPGYVCAFANVVLLLGHCFLFVEPPPGEKENVFVALWRDPQEYPRVKRESRRVLVTLAGWWNLSQSFAMNFLVASLEAFITPITSHFGFGALENSAMFASFAFMGVVGVFLSRRLDKRGVPINKIILGGVVTVTAGVITMTGAIGPGQPALLSVATLCTFVAAQAMVVGALLSAVTSAARYTKAIGQGPQGFFGALQSLTMGVAKIFGPLLSGLALEQDVGGDTYFVLFGILLVPTILNLVGLLCVYHKQVDPPEDMAREGSWLDGTDSKDGLTTALLRDEEALSDGGRTTPPADEGER